MGVTRWHVGADDLGGDEEEPARRAVRGPEPGP